MDLHWWSIEIRDGSIPARLWREGYGEALTEAAITHRAGDWLWLVQRAGLVFEIGFVEAEDWLRFRDLPAVRAALDAVPDPVNGLYIYPGRGGSAGAGKPRRPRPRRGAGAAPVPVEPQPVVVAGHPPAEFQPPTISVV